jgi:hypothetical protein
VTATAAATNYTSNLTIGAQNKTQTPALESGDTPIFGQALFPVFLAAAAVSGALTLGVTVLTVMKLRGALSGPPAPKPQPLEIEPVV